MKVSLTLDLLFVISNTKKLKRKEEMKEKKKWMKE
jgi:hypothetical protein